METICSKSVEEVFLTDLRVALSKLPGFSIERSGDRIIRRRSIVGETMDHKGIDLAICEKQGRYFLSEQDETSFVGSLRTVVLVHEAVTTEPLLRGTVVRGGKVARLVGFPETFDKDQRMKNASQLFLDFSTCCRRFLKI